MLTIISPSKTLDFDTTIIGNATQPRLLAYSEELIKKLRTLSKEKISQLMKLSPALTTLNYERYHSFSTPFTTDNAKQAVCVFKGNVYDGINVGQYTEDDFDSAQKHLRILSGLYGLLRPRDLIQPYRLEMGTRLENTKGKNLYEFWGEEITNLINKDMKAIGTDTLINLASNEYWKAVKPKNINGRIITISFKEHKNGEYKMVMVHVKKARGLMASYIVKHHPSSPELLKKFNEDGYRFNAALSDDSEWVFTR